MFSNTPFTMSMTQIIENAMNPEKNLNLTSQGDFNDYSILGTTYKMYDPYQELADKGLQANKGEVVIDFDEERQDNTPKFQQQDPNQILININVKEQADAFRRKAETSSAINSLFNPVSGNTPEERAKSQQINTLLAEIDNFAIQYNLSQSQKEILKTQILSNHLGDYIRTKNSFALSDRQQEQKEAMDLARGENDTGNAPIVRDPVNGMDENGIRNDVDEGDAGDVIEGAGAAIPGEEETKEEIPAPEPAPAAEAGGGDLVEVSDATEPILKQDVENASRILISVLNNPPAQGNVKLPPAKRGTPRRAEPTVNEATIRAIVSWQEATWFRAFGLYSVPSVSSDDLKFMSDRSAKPIIDYLGAILGFGDFPDAREITQITNILKAAKEKLKTA